MHIYFNHKQFICINFVYEYTVYFFDNYETLD